MKHTIIDKEDILANGTEETITIQLEEETYQQINLIKLEDLNLVHLEEIRKELDKKKS